MTSSHFVNDDLSRYVNLHDTQSFFQGVFSCSLDLPNTTGGQPEIVSVQFIS